MFKYYQPLQNRSGDALADYYVRLFDASGTQVDIFADQSSTPIATESGVTNAAKSDNNGMVRFYVPSGTYDLRIYDATDTFVGPAEVGIPMIEGISELTLAETGGAALVGSADGNVQADIDARPTSAALAETGGAALVGTTDGDVQTDLDARPTSAALASSSGGEMVGFVQAEADAEDRTTTDKLYSYYDLLDFIPASLRAGVRNRSGTTDLAPYIQNALDNVPSGAEIYAPEGTYRMATGVSTPKSITLVGDPSRENFDNSWDAGRCGTEFDYRGTTGDAFTFAAPNAGNSRINVTLRDLIVRGSRVSASGTTGHCIRINGRAQAGTFVRLIVDNVHVCEAPENGWLLEGDVYGGRMSDIFAHRCGKAGFYAGTAAIGEMVFERVRCFQNGQTGTGDDQTCGFYWEAGSAVFNGLSCSENIGPGAYLNGGPIVINMLQLESNGGTKQLLLGRSSTGIQSVVINGIQTAPGTGYTGSHVYITQYCQRTTIIGGFLGDTLGVGGSHIYRENAATDLTYDHLGSTAAFSVTDLSAAGFGTHQMVRVFARNSSAFSNSTGDGTDVDWIPSTEIFDNLGAYDAATGVFTAPVTGFYDIEVAIPLADLSSAFDNATIFFTASSYSRTYRMGNVGAMRSNVNQYTMQARARIPMKQAETLKVVFNVGGGTKVVDVVADPAYGFLSIVTAH